MKSDSLDDLLRQLRQEGKLESQGRFTLSPEKLREKLAAFQFERSSQWVLKVIQALVLAKVESCDILQSHHRTEFVIKSSLSLFRLDELEGAFFDPEFESNVAVKNLMTALWFLSFNLQLAWLWTGRDSEFGLVWTGTEFQRVAIPRGEVSRLEVSHIERKSENHWWSNLLSDFSLLGASGCAEIARELTLNAYTCPFPLKLDGRRLDSLLHCSSISQPQKLTTGAFGIGNTYEKVHIAALGWGKAGLPIVALPPGTLAAQSQGDFVARRDSPESPNGAGWIAFLLAHLHTISNGKTVSWRPYPSGSCVTWVRHGVVVEEGPLLTVSAISCHLFLSADERKVDISGLKMRLSSVILELSLKIDVLDWLNHQSISFSPRHEQAQRVANLLAGTIGIGAAFYALSSGSFLFGLEGFGVAALAKFFVSVNEDSLALEDTFNAELEKLREEWIDS